MIRIKIQEALDAQGHTRYWLVKRADTTYPVINKLADGRAVHLNLDVFERICRALEVSPGELLELDDGPADGGGTP